LPELDGAPASQPPPGRSVSEIAREIQPLISTADRCPSPKPRVSLPSLLHRFSPARWRRWPRCSRGLGRTSCHSPSRLTGLRRLPSRRCSPGAVGRSGSAGRSISAREGLRMALEAVG